MGNARCSCGAVTLSLPAQAGPVVVCHCIDCQRRTGAPFGAGAFYPARDVVIAGVTTEFTRHAASGNKVSSHFCPTCGSTVFWKSTGLPGYIGVAVGALADPGDQPPARSVFEQSKHAWVEITGAGVAHFRQGSASKQPD